MSRTHRQCLPRWLSERTAKTRAHLVSMCLTFGHLMPFGPGRSSHRTLHKSATNTMDGAPSQHSTPSLSIGSSAPCKVLTAVRHYYNFCICTNVARTSPGRLAAWPQIAIANDYWIKLNSVCSFVIPLVLHIIASSGCFSCWPFARTLPPPDPWHPSWPAHCNWTSAALAYPSLSAPSDWLPLSTFVSLAILVLPSPTDILPTYSRRHLVRDGRKRLLSSLICTLSELFACVLTQMQLCAARICQSLCSCVLVLVAMENGKFVVLCSFC